MKVLLSVLAVVVLAGGGLGFWYLHQSGGGEASFRTAPVERGDLLATISATGTLEPEDVIDVGAQVVGQIREFGRDLDDSGKAIDYGSRVEVGTVLARIDDSKYKERVAQSRARLEQAKVKVEQAEAQVDQARANQLRAEADLLNLRAKLKQAEADWERGRRLRASNSISQQEYDALEAAADVARSALAQGDAAVVQAKAAVKDANAAVAVARAAIADAEAVLRQDDLELGYCTIKSPVAGVIIDRRVNIGQTVQSSFNTPSLFLIAKDLRRMQVWASVNEADIGQVRKGQDVRFTVDAYPREVFHGKVNQVRLNASMIQNVVTYTVVVDTDNPVSDEHPRGKLLPYLTANLQFEVDKRRDVLLVPNAALRWRPQPQQVAADARTAYVQSQRRKEADKPAGEPDRERLNRGTVWLEENGFVRPVKLQLGLSDGNVTEVIEVLEGDLDKGDQVIAGATRPGSDGDGTTNPFTTKMFGEGKKKE